MIGQLPSLKLSALANTSIAIAMTTQTTLAIPMILTTDDSDDSDDSDDYSDSDDSDIDPMKFVKYLLRKAQQLISAVHRIECFNYNSRPTVAGRDFRQGRQAKAIYGDMEQHVITHVNKTPGHCIREDASLRRQYSGYSNYDRDLNDLIFELAAATIKFPGWLTINVHHPSSLIPVPPPFEANESPEYSMTRPVRKYIRSRTYFDFDLRIYNCPNHRMC